MSSRKEIYKFNVGELVGLSTDFQPDEVWGMIVNRFMATNRHKRQVPHYTIKWSQLNSIETLSEKAIVRVHNSDGRRERSID